MLCRGVMWSGECYRSVICLPNTRCTSSPWAVEDWRTISNLFVSKVKLCKNSKPVQEEMIENIWKQLLTICQPHPHVCEGFTWNLLLFTPAMCSTRPRFNSMANSCVSPVDYLWKWCALVQSIFFFLSFIVHISWCLYLLNYLSQPEHLHEV